MKYVLICCLALFVKLSSTLDSTKPENLKNKSENLEKMPMPDQQIVPTNQQNSQQNIATNNFLSTKTLPVSLYQTQKYIAVPLLVAEARSLLPVVLVNGKELDTPENNGYPPLPSEPAQNFQFTQQYQQQHQQHQQQRHHPQKLQLQQQQQNHHQQQQPYYNHQIPFNAKTDIRDSKQFASRQLNIGKPGIYAASPTTAQTQHMVPSIYKPSQNYATHKAQSYKHRDSLTHALSHPPFFVPKSITAAIKKKQQELKVFKPSYPVDYYDK